MKIHKLKWQTLKSIDVRLCYLPTSNSVFNPLLNCRLEIQPIFFTLLHGFTNPKTNQ